MWQKKLPRHWVPREGKEATEHSPLDSHSLRSCWVSKKIGTSLRFVCTCWFARLVFRYPGTVWDLSDTTFRIVMMWLEAFHRFMEVYFEIHPFLATSVYSTLAFMFIQSHQFVLLLMLGNEHTWVQHGLPGYKCHQSPNQLDSWGRSPVKPCHGLSCPQKMNGHRRHSSDFHIAICAVQILFKSAWMSRIIVLGIAPYCCPFGAQSCVEDQFVL